MYEIFNKKSELEQAQATLDNIVNKLQTLNIGTSMDYLVTSPKDWNILVYSNPNKICICPKKESRELASCSEAGVCKMVLRSTEILSNCLMAGFGVLELKNCNEIKGVSTLVLSNVSSGYLLYSSVNRGKFTAWTNKKTNRKSS